MTSVQTDRVIIGGVDTHKDIHVAAAIDGVGRILGTETLSADVGGYRRLLGWLRRFGPLGPVGVEGTGCWGAGLSRYLAGEGVAVVEVNRPNRQTRRRRGKSDTVDAEAAARAVLSGEATGIPKAGTGQVECIRMLRVARRGAMKVRTQAAMQLHNLVDTAPEDLWADLRGLSIGVLAARVSRFRPGPSATIGGAAKRALASVGRRWLAANAEMADLSVELDALVVSVAPALTGMHCVGPETAGALLVAAGDNPHRMRTEAGFAALCGVNPIEASSGRTVRHRLNRSGNREANSALWRIVLVRLRSDARTQAYMSRRTAEGRTKREVMRCLKRYVARDVYRAILHDLAAPA